MEPVEFRRRLHAHPELSFKEHDTAAFIEQQLDELGIEHRRIASTGVVARIKGRKTPEGDRRAAVLRADIDALPVTERNDCEWRSQNEGVMHACGHDMHAAVLFGVLKTFAEAPDFRGTLFGLFQPGEECNPGGASLVLAEKPFEGYDVRAVVGEHVEPQLEVGTLGFRAGKYMAASDELRFRVRGTGGHGAMRKQLKDPVAAGAELLTRLIALNGEECVLSIGRVEAGGATNIVPDEIYMEGTLRTFDERERGIIHRRGHRRPARREDRSDDRPRLSVRRQRRDPREAGHGPGQSREAEGRDAAPAHHGRGFRVLLQAIPVAVLPAGRGRCGRTPAHGDILPRRSGYRRGHRLHAETGPATPGKITPCSAKRTQAGRDSGKTGTTEIRRRTEALQIFKK